MIDRFLVVVVIYETELEKSITLQRLSALKVEANKDLDILIYDNSFTSKLTSHFKDFLYHHEPLNTGVSGAYNYAMQLASRLHKEWLILFDQDTSIGDPTLKNCLAPLKNIRMKIFFARLFYRTKKLFRLHTSFAKRQSNQRKFYRANS